MVNDDLSIKIAERAESIYYFESCTIQEAVNKARRELGLEPAKFKGQEDD